MFATARSRLGLALAMLLAAAPAGSLADQASLPHRIAAIARRQAARLGDTHVRVARVWTAAYRAERDVVQGSRPSRGDRRVSRHNPRAYLVLMHGHFTATTPGGVVHSTYDYFILSRALTEQDGGLGPRPPGDLDTLGRASTVRLR